MNDVPVPESWKGRVVSTLDILMFIRQKVSEGMSPRIFLRKLDAQLLVAFECGSAEALRHNALPGLDSREAWFIEWLRDFKQEFPPEGWHQKFLAEMKGDHLAALRKYLDRVAEFVALRDAGQLPAPPYREVLATRLFARKGVPNFFEPPADWKERPVCTLDILRYVRDKVNAGLMLEMFFGRVDIYSLAAFVEGIELTLHYNRLPDPGFREFIASLRDFRGEPLQADWPEHALQETDGNHRAAIHGFLARATGFVARPRG
jgi:hypothetical protein